IQSCILLNGASTASGTDLSTSSTGSIITSQWVVTAAHCVHKLPQVSSWVVYAGIVTRSSTKMAQHTGYAVEKIIYNKNYNHRSHDSDIALMKLRTPLNFSDTIRPVCLPRYEYDLPGGTQCWISGWGYTQPDGGKTLLQQALVPIISTKKCNSSCMYNGEITSRMLCAGYTEGKVDACQGDSGGPLVCQDENVWRLVGVVSWGTGCAEPNHPGVYTKVAEFLSWIYDMIEVNRLLRNSVVFVQYKGTKYLHLMLFYTFTPQHFRARYCTLYCTTFTICRSKAYKKYDHSIKYGA
uniref:Transmembrane serine protease 5 n=1 Tax=Seriola lalandi dorsalis TaxID=1841481 RepID=A0A3B4WFH7_SERLL